MVVIEHYDAFATLNRVTSQQLAILGIQNKVVLSGFQHNPCSRTRIGSDWQAIKIPSIRDRVVFAYMVLFTDRPEIG